MPLSQQFANYVLEQSERVTLVTARRMFAGMGVYGDGLFFAILHDDAVYFKVDDGSHADFERAGMRPFRPYAERAVTMQYYELPVEVLEDEEALLAWVKKSIEAAGSKPPAAGRPPRPSSTSRTCRSRPKLRRR